VATDAAFEEAARLEAALRDSKDVASELSEEAARLGEALRVSKAASELSESELSVAKDAAAELSEEAARLEEELRQATGAASDLAAAEQTRKCSAEEEAAARVKMVKPQTLHPRP